MSRKINALEEAYLYWLYTIDGIGTKKRSQLLTVMGSAQAVYELQEEVLGALRFLSEKDKELIRRAKQKKGIEEFYGRLAEKKIRFVMQHHKEYPTNLRKAPDAPFGLFVSGRLPAGDRPCVAVIGARDCSEYGRYVAAELGRRLANARIQVVSGLARGVDSIAQHAAVSAGGEVFGVLGCGVDVCYPRENRPLYQKLMQTGGILSEYPPGTQPKAGLFPKRNRIISGLADAIVVVEAREKSGTLITVDMALEQGREVYVIPGRVTDPLSFGCNRLIGQGAAVLTNITDFIGEIEALHQRQKAEKGEKQSAEERIEKSVEKSTEMSIEKSIERSMEQSAEMSMAKSVEQSQKNRFRESCEKTPEDGRKQTAFTEQPFGIEKDILNALYLEPRTLQQIYTSLSGQKETELPKLVETLYEMEKRGRIVLADGFYHITQGRSWTC